MHCIICKKSGDETHLYEGIYEGRISNICESCAKQEGIPLIKKPTPEQLNEADREYTVNERMKKLAGLEEPLTNATLSKEQSVAYKNLAKLRFPAKKQHHEDLVDDYYWRIQYARRRKKFPISHVAREIQVSEEEIQSLERGVLPKDFRTIIAKLENFFDIRLYKQHQVQKFLKKPSNIDEQEEKKILEKVKQKIQESDEKKDKINKIQKGEMDFSKRENLQNITLNDLIELKKKQEEQKEQHIKEKLTRDMFGDDLEIEFDD